MQQKDVYELVQAAPDFTATAVLTRNLRLLNCPTIIGKYVILFFYPLDFYVCLPD